MQSIANYTFREAKRDDIPAMKAIRDNVHENALVSAKIEIEDYAKALFQDGKGWVVHLKIKLLDFHADESSKVMYGRFFWI